ncbi:MAG: hypothetical protein ABIH37_05825 [archaeon]
MINTTNLNEARKQIMKLKKEGKEVVVVAQDDDFNRKIFENKDVDMVVGLELHDRKDFMKQRDSGLNEINCKLAHDNNIKIGIDVGKIGKLEKIEKARVLARVRQNIQLCKRTGTKIVVLGDSGKQEIMSLFLVLGGSTSQGKEGLR